MEEKEYGELLEVFRRYIGEEFCFVDKVVRCDPDANSIETVFRYDPEDPRKKYLQAHFIERKMMPASLILEAMAQASGILALTKAGSAKYVFVAGGEYARFPKPVFPEMTLHIFSNVVKQKRDFLFFHVVVKEDAGTVIAEADLTLYCAR